MNLSLESIVFLFATFNGFLFVAISIAKLKGDRNYLFIAILLLLCTFILFDEFGRWTPDFFNRYPELTFIFTFSWFMLIPIIYLWIRFQVKKKMIQWKDAIHLLPLVFFNLYDNHFTIAIEKRSAFLQAHFSQPEDHIGKYIFSFQIIVYLFLGYRLLSRKYNFQGMTLFKKLRGWLQAAVLVLVAYFIAMWVFIITYEVWDIYLIKLDIWKTNLFLIVIYGWLFFAVTKPNIFNYPIRTIRAYKEELSSKRLSEELKHLIYQMEQNQLYLNPSLGLSDMARVTGLSGRKISKMINDEIDLSLSQLANVLRIKEMESRYHDQQYKKYSLEGLAESVGFKSKSSFYRCIKEFTGHTPASYFKNLNT